jgi:hypothetical protein
MNSQKQICSVLFLFALFALFVGRPVLAQKHKLRLGTVMHQYGSSCGSGLIAGSVLILEVRNTADQPLESPRAGWPEGYVLEAALDLPPGEPFVPTSGLIERLSPEPFFDLINLDRIRRLEDGDTQSVDRRALNAKHFAMQSFADLAGHTLTIRALFRRDSVELQDELGHISIVAPCDRADTARIAASRVFFAWVSKDWDGVIVLADSMLARDLSNPIAWEYALPTAVRMAPEKKEYYARAVAYLDRMYQDYGVVSIDWTFGVPRWDRGGPRDPRKQEAYERQRDALLRLIAKEDQKQQK